MNDMDLGIILGTTLWDDDLADIYPREALLEAGLSDPTRVPQKAPRSFEGSPDASVFRKAPSWLHGSAVDLAEETGRTSGVLVTISSTKAILWSKAFPSIKPAIKGSFWAGLRHSSSDLHFWDIPSLLQSSVNAAWV